MEMANIQWIINKTMDRQDLFTSRGRVIVRELNSLIKELRARDLIISSWYGKLNLSGSPSSWERLNRGLDYRALDGAADDTKFPWYLYWEIVWVTINS